MIQNAHDPIPAIDRATAIAVGLYDRLTGMEDEGLRARVLTLLAYLRAARKAAE